MAAKKKAAKRAGAERKKASSQTEEQERSKAEAAEASKKLDETQGKARTAREAQDEDEETLAARHLDHVAESEAAQRQREKWRAEAVASDLGDVTFRINRTEESALRRFLTKLRALKASMLGEVERKAFLVNETGSDRVRWGGRTYTVPEGRHELTDEFVAEYMPDGVTVADLTGGLLGGRVKIEYEDPAEQKGKGKAGQSTVAILDSKGKKGDKARALRNAAGVDKGKWGQNLEELERRELQNAKEGKGTV